MLRTNLRYALRNLAKNRGFSALNIFGLSLGICFFLLIAFYVIDELGYDRFNEKADRIFRVQTDGKFGPDVTHYAITAPPVAAGLARSFPEIEKATRILKATERFAKGSDFITEQRVAYCDSTIGDVFTLPLVHGDPSLTLRHPDDIIISESMAMKYFGSTDVVGKTLNRVDDSSRFDPRHVSGVMKDMPAQAHFHFDFILSLASIPLNLKTNYLSMYPFNTYVLLKPTADYRKLDAKLPGFVKSALASAGLNEDEFEKDGRFYRLHLMPITDIHLQSNRFGELEVNGSIQYVRIFGAVALIVLLVACINFMNLSTARSSNRSREVGVRKVLGSSRSQLVFQFLFEALLVTALAAVIASLGACLLLPVFNSIADKNLHITKTTMTLLIPVLLAVISIVGVLSGSFPALFLSSFQPVDVLNGKLVKGSKGVNFRNILVVFQFCISIFLISGTLVIYRQLHFIQNKNLGFNRNQVLVVRGLRVIEEQAKIFKQEVASMSGVRSVTVSSFLPTEGRWLNNLRTDSNDIQSQYWPVDADYLETLGMTVVSGRNFSREGGMDSSGMILNETAARMLMIKDDLSNPNLTAFDKRYHVIGVVRDFNFGTMREKIGPVALTLLGSFERNVQGSGPETMCIRVNTGDVPGFIERLKRKWMSLVPNTPLQYSFMDKDYEASYRSEMRMGEIFVVFAGLALIIACMGLFGLAVYAAEQRSKEMTIRKILGASVTGVVALLSKDFLKLVMLAIVISFPLAWYGLSKWLENFEFRIEMPWGAMAIAGFSVFMVTILTVGWQALKVHRKSVVIR